MKTKKAGWVLFAIIVVMTISVPVLAQNAAGAMDCSAVAGGTPIVDFAFAERLSVLCWPDQTDTQAPTPGESISGSSILWEQTSAGVFGQAGSSDYWIGNNAGIYSASDFVLWSDATIELIFAEGDHVGGGSLISQPAIDWVIYPDAGGIPAGHPEDGGGTEVWSYSSTPTGPGVDVTDSDNILLDLSAAGQNLQLTAGRYWLVIYPTYANTFQFPGWYWHDASSQIDSFSQVVDPQDIAGFGQTTWAIWPIYSENIDDMAFRIEGTITGPVPSQYIPIITLNSDPNPPAGWSDNFDAYGTGVPLHGLGGWKGWGNDPALGASTSAAQAHTAPNSVDISGNADLVQEFAIDDGIWTFKTRQYIPGSFTGTTYIIMMNQYDDACSNCNWSVQVKFAGGVVSNDGVSLGAKLYKTDQWVEIRIEIDLVRNKQSFYYDGQLLYSGTWGEEVSGGGITSIEALNLFANGASSVYYDDISLTKK